MKVAIIVPVYRVEKYLKRCIDSVLAQTYKAFEVVLVDDGSPDNCGKICDEYAEKYDNVHVIHRVNGGLSAARNSGIDWVLSNAKSQWITFVDSDDWLHPQMLDFMIRACEKTNAQISVCHFKRVREYAPVESNGMLERMPNPLAFSPEGFWIWCYGEGIDGVFTSNIACCKLYATSLLEEQRFPEQIRAHEDVFTTYKILFSAQRIAVIELPLYYYFINPASITGNQWSPSRLNAIEGGREQLRFFKDNGYKHAFRVSAHCHLNRLLWNYGNALKNPNSVATLEKIKEFIAQDFDKCRSVLPLSAGSFFQLAVLVHPIKGRIMCPIYFLFHCCYKMIEKARKAL